MIRRNLPLGEAPREWLLISQVEHARLSYFLAEHWGNDNVAPVICAAQDSSGARLQIRREALAGIAHHDDGWTNWEAAPAIDPAYGRPFDFMEMPQADAIEIWTRSVFAARDEGPLAGAMTAGHFLALLANSHNPPTSASDQWRSEFEHRRSEWLQSWHEQAVALHSSDIADQALRWLQAFDWLSLWLCCKCPASLDDFSQSETSLELAVLGQTEPPIRFRAACTASGHIVYAEPWPFNLSKLDATIACTAVPTKSYGSADELLNSRRFAELHWHLRPRDRL
jgi:hypothetical protein